MTPAWLPLLLLAQIGAGPGAAPPAEPPPLDPAAACVTLLGESRQAALVAAAYNDRGKSALQGKDLPGALHAFRLAAALQPEHAEYANNLAFLYEQSGQPALAEAGYLHALALDPGRAVAHVNFAEFLVARTDLAGRDRAQDRAQDLALAEDHLRQALALPGHEALLPCSVATVAALRGRCTEAQAARALCAKTRGPRSRRERRLGEVALVLGDCRFAEGDYDAAQAAWADAAKVKLALGDRPQRLETARARVAVPPPTPPEPADAQAAAEAHVREAFALFDAGEAPDRAAALIAQAAQQAPALPAVHAARAELAARQGAASEAEALWFRALNLGLVDDKLAARAHAGLGRLYLRWPQGPRPAEAAVLLAQAVRRDPQDAALRWDLVAALREAGQLARALAELDRYLRHPRPAAGVAQHEALALRRSLQTTLGLAGEAPPTPPEPGPPADPRAEARRLAGEDRWQEAVAVLGQELDRGTATKEMLNDLALYRQGLGDTRGAVAAWRASLELDDEQPAVHDELARWLLRQGDLPRARRHLLRAEALGVLEASYHLARLDAVAPADRLAGLIYDLQHRAELQALVVRLDRYLALAATRKGPPPPEVAAARALRRDLDQRLQTGAWLALGLAGLVLLALLLVAWRVFGGHDLRALVARHPESGPELQRILAAVRHEVLKHNTMVLTGLVHAVETDEDAAAAADHVREALFGGAGREAAADRLAGYVHQLEQLGRAYGLRLNLRRRDAAMSPILRGFAVLRRAAPRLGRVDRLGPVARARLLRDLRLASRLLHTEGYEAVRNLLDSLRLLRIDAALVQSLFERTCREPGFASARIAPLALAFEVEQPAWAPIPRQALDDILTNLMRNALQSSLRAEAAPARIGVRVDSEVSEITGLERLVLAVCDASPEDLAADRLRGRRIEEGIGLVGDLVARYEGTLDVQPEAAPWRKAVVVRLPRARPGQA